MKGTDVTPEQLAHAEEFLQSAQGWKLGPRGEHTVANHTTVTIAKADLIRLLAWYGAIRAKGGRETPNPLVNRSGPGDTMDFGTPEQLADMPPPQPAGKIVLAAVGPWCVSVNDTKLNQQAISRESPSCLCNGVGCNSCEPQGRG